MYAADGSWNVVVVQKNDLPISLYHPCGALRVCEATTETGTQAPNGATYVSGASYSILMAGSETDVLTMASIDDTMTIRSTSDTNDNYQGTPGAKLTTTRASSATYWDSNGILQSAGNNTLRRDFDPRLSSTTERCGYLIEEARTNLALQSEDITTTWGQNATTRTVNVAVAPDGATTADLITPTSGNSNHFISQAITHTAASYTISAFVKPNGYTKCGFRENTTLGSHATFDCSGAGSVLHTAGGATGVIVALPNGYYRVSMTYTGAAAAQTMGFYVLDAAYTTGSPNSYTYVGDTVSGLHAWGFQDELGSFASSYIPTAGSTVTRAADLPTLAGTLFPLNQSEGTLYAKWMCMGLSSANQYALSLNDGTLNEFMGILRNSSLKANSLLTAGGSNQLGPGGVGLVSTANVSNLSQSKSAFGYKLNDCAVAQAGETVQTDIVCIMPTTTTLVLGNLLSGTPRALNGWLFEAAYFPTRKTNSQLQSLASGYASDALLLMGAETQGLTFAATDQSMTILDTGTPANNYTGDLVTKLGAIRASAGYHYNSAGLLVSSASGLRLDYDSRLTGGPGYLVEEARTNGNLWSEDLSNAAYAKTDTTITADQAAGPDGLTKLDLCTQGTAGTASVYQTIAYSANTVVTASWFVRRGNNDWVRFAINDSGGTNRVFGWVNLATGALGASVAVAGTGANGALAVQSLGGGLYRVMLTGSVNTANYFCGTTAVDGDASSTRVNNATYYSGYCQVEAGAFATSYIPTTTASVTRAADIPMQLGTTFPLSQTEGTLYARFVSSADSTSLLSLSDGTTAERHQLEVNSSSQVRGRTTDEGVNIASITGDAVSGFTFVRAAYAYKLDNCQLVQAGSSKGTDVSATMPTTTRLYIGASGAGVFPLNGWLREGAVIPRRMSQSEMIAIAA